MTPPEVRLRSTAGRKALVDRGGDELGGSVTVQPADLLATHRGADQGSLSGGLQHRTLDGF